jgi:hypothetical protein
VGFFVKQDYFMTYISSSGILKKHFYNPETMMIESTSQYSAPVGFSFPKLGVLPVFSDGYWYYTAADTKHYRLSEDLTQFQELENLPAGNILSI